MTGRIWSLHQRNIKPMPYGKGTYTKDGKPNEKGRKIESCVAKLMADPNFKPKKGMDKKQSAIAVCRASVGRSDEMSKQLEK